MVGDYFKNFPPQKGRPFCVCDCKRKSAFNRLKIRGTSPVGDKAEGVAAKNPAFEERIRRYYI